MIAGAEARSQTTDLDEDWGPTANRHSSIPLSGAMRRAKETSEETPTVDPRQSRWERFRASVWPINRKQQSDAKVDSSVTKTKLGSAQPPGDVPSIPPLPSPFTDDTIPVPSSRDPNAPYFGQASPLSAAPPSLAELGETSDDQSWSSSPAVRSSGSPVEYEKEPYGLCKRFFRGYGTSSSGFRNISDHRESRPPTLRAPCRISARSIRRTLSPACPIPRAQGSGSNGSGSNGSGPVQTAPGLTVLVGTAPRTGGKRRVQGSGRGEAATSQKKVQGGRRRVPGIRRHFRPRNTRVTP